MELFSLISLQNNENIGTKQSGKETEIKQLRIYKTTGFLQKTIEIKQPINTIVLVKLQTKNLFLLTRILATKLVQIFIASTKTIMVVTASNDKLFKYKNNGTTTSIVI